MMHHQSHHTHVHQVNVHPSSIHPQHPSMNMNIGQQVQHIPNINLNVPPPVPNPRQIMNNRVNQHHRIGSQMRQAPQQSQQQQQQQLQQHQQQQQQQPLPPQQQSHSSNHHVRQSIHNASKSGTQHHQPNIMPHTSVSSNIMGPPQLNQQHHSHHQQQQQQQQQSHHVHQQQNNLQHQTQLSQPPLHSLAQQKPPHKSIHHPSNQKYSNHHPKSAQRSIQNIDNTKNTNHKLLNGQRNNSNIAAPVVVLSATSVQLKPSAPPTVAAKPILPLSTSSAAPTTTSILTNKNNSSAVVSSIIDNTSQLLPNSYAENEIIEVSATNDIAASSTNELSSITSSKEKTPMCLVNELARYNKILHQYRLTGEEGPPHKKRFTVTLKLGDEEYTSDEASIKKAQHSAATEAIVKTKYTHPPAKTKRLRANGKISNAANELGNITPTVELNALAMKRGEAAVYHVEPPIAVAQSMAQGLNASANNYSPANQNSINNSSCNQQYANYSNRNSSYKTQRFPNNKQGGGGGAGRGTNGPNEYNSKYNNYNTMHGTTEDPYKITLEVGSRKFLGFGNTLQSARHDAASKALTVLKPITNEEETLETSLHDDINSDLKSPISLVHEMVLKRKLTVGFKVQSEKGPPHMKTFVTLCIVGDITTEGEGNAKKLSKKRAAETMLEELKKLPPPSPPPKQKVSSKRKPQPVKKKARNLIKDNPETDLDGLNPISRLIRVSHISKAKDPVFTLFEERGLARRKEFVIEVSAVGHKAQGTGRTKKNAKQQAAENLLTLLRYCGKISPVNDDPIDSNSTVPATAVIGEKNRKVTFQENTETVVPSSTSLSNQGGSAGRQLVPGLLLMQQEHKPYSNASSKSGINHQTTATIAKELLSSSSSPTADALAAKSNSQAASSGKHSPIQLNNSSNVATSPTPNATSCGSSTISTDSIRPKDKLLYLAKLLDFKVQFSDFPKGNHGEYLTLITLTTEPPQLCHGSGINTEASHDMAATTALQTLSTLGLDHCNSNNNVSSNEEKKIKPILSNGIKK